MAENKIKIFGNDLSTTANEDGAKIKSENDYTGNKVFAPGKSASSMEHNTVLRQVSFVSNALVEALTQLANEDSGYSNAIFGPGDNNAGDDINNRKEKLVNFFKNRLLHSNKSEIFESDNVTVRVAGSVANSFAIFTSQRSSPVTYNGSQTITVGNKEYAIQHALNDSNGNKIVDTYATKNDVSSLGTSLTNADNIIKTEIQSINDKLKNLGFRSGTITFLGSTYGSSSNTDATSNGIFRLGNFVICNMSGTATLSSSIATSKIFFTIPENFRPKANVTTSFTFFDVSGGSTGGHSFRIVIDTNGTVSYNFTHASTALWNKNVSFNINFGYEANPINS